MINTKISKVLSRLEEQSKRERLGEVVVPRSEMMLAITLDTGTFFNITLKAMRAKRILEIGTSYGYSTLWFAEALTQISEVSNTRPEKSIITIEMDHSKVERANKNFDEAGIKNIIDLKEGQAGDVLSEISKNYLKEEDRLFDFVFFDADKENLRHYFDIVLPMVRVGGIIATDNILYPEEYRSMMTNYTNYIKNKPNIQSMMIPIGNGEELTIKLA
ncbi:MAG: O-methyltransferase [Nitrososphaeraceae archaeon]|nr:O-methyltransferase [Nitrososphaeraceae archaeon]